MNELNKIYSERFKDTYQKREITWQVLTKHYFQKLIPENSNVLEIAAGYCHFINHIKATKKYALDLNPDVNKFAAEDVHTIIGNSIQISELAESSVDVIFVSNFFEHLEKKDILKTLKECKRILKPNGSIFILQPNIRYLYREYWMFFDHITPLDHDSLSEALVLIGFEIRKVIPKFLPFTIQGSKLPVHPWLIYIYSFTFALENFWQTSFGNRSK